MSIRLINVRFIIYPTMRNDIKIEEKGCYDICLN